MDYYKQAKCIGRGSDRVPLRIIYYIEIKMSFKKWINIFFLENQNGLLLN